MSYPPDLKQKLQAALSAKGPDYRPRTKHLLTDGQPKYINRLILENSPYLLQHAHNPVNWFTWGEEAFALAKKLNRPV
ncbi:MAG: thioredoxin domain-containing protein, partial [Gammaproteobacteria bacterium]